MWALLRKGHLIHVAGTTYICGLSYVKATSSNVTFKAQMIIVIESHYITRFTFFKINTIPNPEGMDL
jgi:hypothetical protein